MTHNNSRKPSNTSRTVSNRAALTRLKKLQGPEPGGPGKKRKVVPRSASSSFIARRGPNRWAKFPQRRRKGEHAITTDLAGKPLRSRNFESQRPEILTPTIKSNVRRRRVGDRAYKGPAAGKHVSATRRGEGGWSSGDIAGRRIRGRNHFSKGKRTERAGTHFGSRHRTATRTGRVGTQYGGYRSATRTGRIGKWLPGRTPGIGAEGIGSFKGRVKAQRPLKGGGSVSGRLWNNRGQALAPRTPGIGSQGIGYQGRTKGRRPLKGGGSVSGRLWNNQGRALEPRTPGIGAQGIGYQGRQKAQRPLKGGGSVSGRMWNNRRTPVGVRPPSVNAMKAGGFPGKIKRFSVQPGFRNQGEEFSGVIKTRRPPKGGGSVSGKIWNNGNQPIEGKTAGVGAMRVGRYQGNIKTRKPLKGGGSVSGKLWNNKETPIPVKTPPAGAEKAGGFPGRIKRFSVQPGFSDQGEEFTGVIKTPWYRRAYSRNPNAHEKAVKQQSPDGNVYKVGNLQVAVRQRKYVKNPNAAEDATRKQKPTDATLATGDLQIKVKRRAYVKNPNSAEAALKKLKPTDATLAVDGLQIKVKQHAYGKKPKAAEGALPGWKPSKETVEASKYAKGVRKTWDYIRNPSSSKDAMRVREPGRAFARSTDYQGNIKMRKFDLFAKSNLHPDAKFVKINKNNVAEERDLLTNFKLWWSKLFFKKNETLPDHLKDKGRKPRYDKGEQGLWYD